MGKRKILFYINRPKKVAKVASKPETLAITGVERGHFSK